MAFIGKHELGTMKELVACPYLSQFKVQTLFPCVPNRISLSSEVNFVGQIKVQTKVGMMHSLLKR
jgi:hypothetical protein